MAATNRVDANSPAPAVSARVSEGDSSSMRGGRNSIRPIIGPRCPGSASVDRVLAVSRSMINWPHSSADGGIEMLDGYNDGSGTSDPFDRLGSREKAKCASLALAAIDYCFKYSCEG